MDPRDLTTDPAATRIIGDYLSALESRLPPGRRARREILAEVADGLACAVEARTASGETPTAAAHAAATEFGDPRTVATAFARQLGPAVAHRLGLGLVVTGPLVGLCWLGAYAAGGPDPQSRVAAVLSAMPQYPLILAVTVPAAMIAITGSGWASRFLALPPRLVTAAAVVAAVGCVAGDLSLLTAAALGHTFAVRAGLTSVAALASVVRLSLAGWAGHRVARLRTAAN